MHTCSLTLCVPPSSPFAPRPLHTQDEVCADGTQTQGGPDVLFSSNITRQQLLAKEEKFKVSSRVF